MYMYFDTWSMWRANPNVRSPGNGGSRETPWFLASERSRAPRARNGGFFPLVDFQKGNTLVSLKSVDTAGSTWMGRMQSHVKDLGTRGATVDGNPASMVLDLRVQPGGAVDAASLVQYGQKHGVTVMVKEFQ